MRRAGRWSGPPVALLPAAPLSLLPPGRRLGEGGLAPHPGTSIFGGIPQRFLLLSTNPFSSAPMHLQAQGILYPTPVPQVPKLRARGHSPVPPAARVRALPLPPLRPLELMGAGARVCLSRGGRGVPWWGTHRLWKNSRRLGSFHLPEPSLWGYQRLPSPDRSPSPLGLGNSSPLPTITFSLGPY